MVLEIPKSLLNVNVAIIEFFCNVMGLLNMTWGFSMSLFTYYFQFTVRPSREQAQGRFQEVTQVQYK